MKIIVDSREKWTQPNSADTRIRDYFDRHGIAYAVQKLDVGDYALNGTKTVIDRKQSLEELSRNLLNRSDSSRFWREVRRAHEQGIKLIVLCEHGGKIKTIRDVAGWKSKYSPASGRRLLDEMVRLEMSYGVRWVFCGKRSTGKMIVQLLEEGSKECLSGGTPKTDSI